MKLTIGRRAALILVASLVLALGGVGIGAGVAEAYSHVGCKWPSNSVRYTSIAKGSHLAPSKAAIANWDTTTDIKLTGRAGTAFLISTAWTADPVAGFTEYFCDGWGHFMRVSSYANTRMTGSYSAKCKQWVYAHEIGHGLGLGHSSTRSTAMWRGAEACVYYGVFRVQKDDIRGMNALY